MYCISDDIICFDYKLKKWYIGKKEEKYKIPRPLRGHQSMISEENNGLYLYIFGGRDSNVLQNVCWKLRLSSKSIDWQIERLIWIGYLKNDHANNINHDIDSEADESNMKVSRFSTLPKDVVSYILSFMRGQFIFE